MMVFVRVGMTPVIALIRRHGTSGTHFIIILITTMLVVHHIHRGDGRRRHATPETTTCISSIRRCRGDHGGCGRVSRRSVRRIRRMNVARTCDTHGMTRSRGCTIIVMMVRWRRQDRWSITTTTTTTTARRGGGGYHHHDG